MVVSIIQLHHVDTSIISHLVHRTLNWCFRKIRGIPIRTENWQSLRQINKESSWFYVHSALYFSEVIIYIYLAKAPLNHQL